MTKKDEVSTLYRTYAPAFNAYEHDGDGRDMYIAFNNGGFWNNRIPPGTSLGCTSEPSTKYHFRWPSREAVTFKYRSDGRGRDTYILKNSAGLYRDDKPLSSYHLTDFLRTCDDGFIPRARFGSRGQKILLSRDENKINMALWKNQKGVIDRLYTQEKHKFIPGL